MGVVFSAGNESGGLRVLLKISGEVLGGTAGAGLDASALERVALEVSAGARSGVQVALVVGGGNFVRGAEIVDSGISRVAGDSIGMLATIMNGIALSQVLTRIGQDSVVLSAFPAGAWVEPFTPLKCVEQLESGKVVILAGGTGNPYFTTDTGASLRALEVGADLLLKGTKVDGIYSDDPAKNPEAELYDSITFRQAIEEGLSVMDTAAFAMCRENRLSLRVFNMVPPGNIERALIHGDIGTKVTAAS